MLLSILLRIKRPAINIKKTINKINNLNNKVTNKVTNNLNNKVTNKVPNKVPNKVSNKITNKILYILEDSKYDYSNINNELLNLKLDYYIIHLERATFRLNNINNLKKILNKNIIIFDAIDGNNIIDITDTIIFKNSNIEAPYNIEALLIKDKFCKGEIGNYLSHLSLLYKIKQLNYNEGYTVIFEDDIIFKFDLDNRIRGILGKIKDDFDIIFLGDDITNNFSENYIDEIYYIDKTRPLWGTHGYIINNKNINKFYEHFSYFNKETDVLIKDLINDNKLNGFIINPSIVIQNHTEFPSEIYRRSKNYGFILKYLKNKKINK